MIGLAPLASGPVASGAVASSSTSTALLGPQVSTTLTNKPAGPPGRHFTRKEKENFLLGIYHEGLLAREALGRVDRLSDLEKAEQELFKAEAAHDAALSAYDVTDTRAALGAARDKVAVLRVAETKGRALQDAKDRIRQQVKDAIAKRRGH